MGKNKKNKSKPEGAGAGPPVAVGGIKITDARTKNNKSGGASLSVTSDKTTNKKLKVAQESKSSLPAEKPADRPEVKQNVKTTEAAQTVPEPVENKELPETDSKAELEKWDDFDENSCNLPSNEDDDAKLARKNEQNDDWSNETANQVEKTTNQEDLSKNTSESDNSLLNKDNVGSSISKNEHKTADFAKKGAVYKESQSNNSYGSKNNQREFGNTQQQSRSGGRGSNSQNSDYQVNQSQSDRYRERGSRERRNDSGDYRRDPGKSQEQNEGMGTWDGSWSKNDNRQDARRDSGKNQNQYKNQKNEGNFLQSPGIHQGNKWGSGNPEQNRSTERGNDSLQSAEYRKSREQNTGGGAWVSSWPKTYNRQDDHRDSGKNENQYSNQKSKSSFNQSPGNYEASRWDSGNQETNRSRGNRSQDDSYQQRRPNANWQNYHSPNRNNEGKDKEFDEFWKYLKSSREKNYVKVHEMDGDLFAMPKENSLAHCVAEDMAMGSGIAVQFSRDFKRRDELLQQRQKQGGLAILEIEERYIYYLVTKQKSTGKPTLYTLWSSLQKMQQHIQEHKVTKLAMPRIGCGLDRLEWSDVKAMLEYTFQNTDVEITVCNFQQPEDGSLSTPARSLSCPVRNAEYPLVDIDKFTAVVYFGSEDGFVTEEIQSLDTKFKIIQDYKNANKRVGEVIQSIKLQNTYILYGFIIKKLKDDLFDFINFQKCINSFKKMNTKQQASEFVGIQAFLDDDKLIMSKIVNMLRYGLRDVEVYVCWPGKMAPFMPQDRRFNSNY